MIKSSTRWSSLTRCPSVKHRGPILRHIRACLLMFAMSLRRRSKRVQGGMVQGILASIQNKVDVMRVKVMGYDVSRCTFSLMSMLPVNPVGVLATIISSEKFTFTISLSLMCSLWLSKMRSCFSTNFQRLNTNFRPFSKLVWAI